MGKPQAPTGGDVDERELECLRELREVLGHGDVDLRMGRATVSVLVVRLKRNIIIVLDASRPSARPRDPAIRVG